MNANGKRISRAAFRRAMPIGARFRLEPVRAGDDGRRTVDRLESRAIVMQRTDGHHSWLYFHKGDVYTAGDGWLGVDRLRYTLADAPEIATVALG